MVDKIVFTSKILEKMLLQAEIRRRKQKQTTYKKTWFRHGKYKKTF